MSAPAPSPEIEALLVTDEQLREATGVSPGDPMLDATGGRRRHALVAGAAGLGAALCASLALVPDLRWPGAVSAAALVAFAISALVEWDEGAVVTAVLVLASLVWFGLRMAGASAGSLATIVAVLASTAVAAYAIARKLRQRRRETLGYDVLGKLRDAIRRYNGLVRALDVRDRLARAQGKSIDPAELAPVLSVLATTRANLVRAITVQRILRENKDVLDRAGGNRFEDLVPVEALRIEGEAEQYGDVVGETVELAADVQRAYDELREELR
jgi:hypothetical protein